MGRAHPKNLSAGSWQIRAYGEHQGPPPPGQRKTMTASSAYLKQRERPEFTRTTGASSMIALIYTPP